MRLQEFTREMIAAIPPGIEGAARTSFLQRLKPRLAQCEVELRRSLTESSDLCESALLTACALNEAEESAESRDAPGTSKMKREARHHEQRTQCKTQLQREP